MMSATLAWLISNIARSMPRWLKTSPDLCSEHVLRTTKDIKLAQGVYDACTAEMFPKKHARHLEHRREMALREAELLRDGD
jgi:hypothetical protein